MLKGPDYIVDQRPALRPPPDEILVNDRDPHHLVLEEIPLLLLFVISVVRAAGLLRLLLEDVETPLHRDVAMIVMTPLLLEEEDEVDVIVDTSVMMRDVNEMTADMGVEAVLEIDDDDEMKSNFFFAQARDQAERDDKNSHLYSL